MTEVMMCPHRHLYEVQKSAPLLLSEKNRNQSSKSKQIECRRCSNKSIFTLMVIAIRSDGIPFQSGIGRFAKRSVYDQRR